jgi:predicted phage terminase large subunit-like protein
MREAMPYTFAGQYMQDPRPDGGGAFKTAMFDVLDAAPSGAVRWVRAWDLAGSNDGDYTAGVKMARLPDGRILVADVVRMRGLAHEVRAAMLATATRDGGAVKISLPQDPGQAGKDQAASLTRMLAGYSVTTRIPSGDKQTRAEPLAAQVNVGNVSLVRGAWNAAFLEEMESFPVGDHDDQVDASADAFGHIFGTPTQAIEFTAVERRRGAL